MLVSVVECGMFLKCVCVCVSVCVCVCVFQTYPICLFKCLISYETAINAHRKIAEYVIMYGHHNSTVGVITVGTEFAHIV